jgi:signal peptidase I
MPKDAAQSGTVQKKSGAEEIVEIVKTIVYALVIALVIRTLLFQPYTIPSASEEPNLYQGDYIIVSKWSYGYSHHSILGSPPLFKGRIFFSPPKRGDVIVFKLPRDGHTDYIKRLIGMPGDRVQMRDGQLYINDRPLKEQPEGNVTVYDRGDAETATLVRETNPEGRQYLTQVHEQNREAVNTTIATIPPTAGSIRACPPRTPNWVVAAGTPVSTRLSVMKSVLVSSRKRTWSARPRSCCYPGIWDPNCSSLGRGSTSASIAFCVRSIEPPTA